MLLTSKLASAKLPLVCRESWVTIADLPAHVLRQPAGIFALTAGEPNVRVMLVTAPSAGSL